jgi:lipopolysaccharide biosynthesis regulator YciM
MDRTRELFQLGERLFETCFLEEAEFVFQKVLQREDDSDLLAQASSYLSNIYGSTHRFDDAERFELEAKEYRERVASVLSRYLFKVG